MQLNHGLMATSEPLRFHKTWLDWYNAVTEALAPVFRGELSVRDGAIAGEHQGRRHPPGGLTAPPGAVRASRA